MTSGISISRASLKPVNYTECSDSYVVMLSTIMFYWETYWKAECWENVPEEERDYNWWVTYAREPPTSQ